MKATDARDLVEAWLEAQGIAVGGLEEAQAQFVASCARELEAGRPAPLPCRSGAFAGYYCVADGRGALRAFRDEVNAFLGPTYGVVEPDDHVLDPADPLEGLLVAAGLTHAFRVARAPGVDIGRIRAAFELLLDTRIRRPPSRHDARRALSNVLRDFEWTLHAGEAEGSQALIREARSLGELSEDSLRFLEVRRIAALGDWDRLWDDGLVDYLLAVPLPMAVADALLSALWHRHLAARHAHGPAALATAFGEEVFPYYGPAFAGVSFAQSPDALRVAMLFAASREPPRLDLAAGLLARAEGDAELVAELDAIQCVVPMGAGAIVPDIVSEANHAADEGEYDRVLSLLEHAPVSLERAVLLVWAAERVPSGESAAMAVTAVGALSDEERTQLPTTPEFKRRLAWAERHAAGVPVDGRPSGWHEWFDAVEADPRWMDAVAIAREGARTWDAEDLLGDEDVVAALAERVVDCDDDVRRVVLAALPALATFLSRVSEDERAVPLAVSVVQLLVLEDSTSPADLDVAVDVLEQVLPVGVDAKAYGQLLEDLHHVWVERLVSYERLDWALGVLDVVARSPVGDVGARDKLVTAVAETAHRSGHRLREAEVSYLVLLARECGLEGLLDAPLSVEAAEEVGEQSVWVALEGRDLGLHCLFVPINRRFCDIVQQLAPTVRIRVDESRKCTDHLRELCRAVDVLILVTQHTTHAASDCVHRHVSSSTSVVASRQSRVGLSAVLRELEDFLREQEVLQAQQSG